MLNNITYSRSLHKELPESYLLLNGTIIDSHNNKEYNSDIRIENGIITSIQKSLEPKKNETVIDLLGKYITSGFFDMHVHFREPGLEHAENVVSGCNAAMAGGFTGVAMMPNTTPCIDNKFLFNDLNSRGNSLLVDTHQIPAITKDRKGEVLVEMCELVENGALAFSDDGSGIQKSESMRGALEYASMFKTPLLVHSEDESFTKGVMHEGYMSTLLGMPAIPSLAEEVMISRDIQLAEYTDGRVHFQHVSTKGAVELVRNAKKKGLKVTCEATPHHFSLTDKSLESFNTNLKMSPPLRSEDDLLAVKEGLKDGTIDVIATDHAPHTPESKEKEFNFAPFGVIGLETCFSAGYTNLVQSGVLTLREFVAKLNYNPRNILNLETDLLKEGSKANLVVFDINIKVKIIENSFKSKARNSCFIGETFTGKVDLVINKNKIYQN